MKDDPQKVTAKVTAGGGKTPSGNGRLMGETLHSPDSCEGLAQGHFKTEELNCPWCP